MRASLLLPSFLVLTLATGVALAEKSGFAAPKERVARVTESRVREIKVEAIRARGDVERIPHQQKPQRENRMDRDRSERTCTPGSAGCRVERAKPERAGNPAAERARAQLMAKKLQRSLCQKKVTNCTGE